MKPGKIGGVDVHLPWSSCTKPDRQTLDRGRGHPTVTDTVHFEDRGQRARREAPCFFQCEPAIRGRLPAYDSQAALESSKVIRSAGQTATQTATDPNHVAPWFGETERCVVGGDRGCRARRNAEMLGHGVESLRTQPAFDLLHRKQGR